MVRFIIKARLNLIKNLIVFTFQYGQIYYAGIRDQEFLDAHIYIPIWLDLLSNPLNILLPLDSDLHSNMVRFIINFSYYVEEGLLPFTFQYGQIYYKYGRPHYHAII